MKYFTLVVSFFISSFLSFGQRIVSPLEYNPEQAEHYTKNSRSRLMAAGDTLTIPFFDDFTQNTVSPDINKWVPNGGTYINSNYPVQPPNYNVATFDGLQENGTPYNTTNVTQTGLTDNLTSRPINLSGVNSADSVFLRFYWQGAGLGEKPDATDSIRLQFKNSSGVWNRVWSVTGDSTPFNHEIIGTIDSAQYYYNGFQFRFQSYGRRSGVYDVWNIDYIHLDTGRLAKENWTPDLSFDGPPTSLLKNYTAMPAEQYFPYLHLETADSIAVKITNIGDRERGYLMDLSESKLSDILDPGMTTQDIIAAPSSFIDSLLVNTGTSIYNKRNIEFTFKPDTLQIPNTVTPRIIKYKFYSDASHAGEADSGDTYEFTGPADLMESRIDFRQNDSISGYTNLTDYYSYDDGTAEMGYGINQILGKVAVLYKLNTQDTLTHIDIYFPRIGVDQSNEPITLTIWNYINPGGTEETFLHRETVSLQYSSSINSFKRYQLQEPIPIPSGDVYIGYQQSTNEVIYTGFDKNKDTKNKIFYNINGYWFSETSESGSLMIRPVFGDPTLLGTKPRSKTELDCEVFPNPSNGTIQIAGKIRNLYLYDLSGRLLLSREYDGRMADVKSEDLSFLPKGFYILHLENEDAKAVKKIILTD